MGVLYLLLLNGVGNFQKIFIKFKKCLKNNEIRKKLNFPPPWLNNPEQSKTSVGLFSRKLHESRQRQKIGNNIPNFWIDRRLSGREILITADHNVVLWRLFSKNTNLYKFHSVPLNKFPAFEITICIKSFVKLRKKTGNFCWKNIV